MKERWAQVVGYEGLYSVSTNGKVRSDTSRNRWEAGRILSPGPNTSGYFQVVLTGASGRRRSLLVNRLVLLAFRGPCLEGMESCHKNGKPQDNRLSNLRWGTRISNLDDRVRHGVVRVPHYRGERNNNVKLTARRVKAMRKRRLAGDIYRVIAESEGVNKSTAMEAIKGKTWSHVPGAVLA